MPNTSQLDGHAPLDPQALGALVSAQQAHLTDLIVAQMYARRPQFEQLYGARGRSKCLQDTHYHLQHLAEALATGAPQLWLEYLAWAKITLAARHIPPDDLLFNLEVMREVVPSQLPAEAGAAVLVYLERALAHVPLAPITLPSLIVPGAPLAELAGQYLVALLAGDRQRASQMILSAVGQGISVRDIYLHVFQPSQQEVGRLWQINAVTVAQEHFCTAATQMVMAQLYPHIFATAKPGRRLVATAVQGELHEIGVRMVADLLEMDGWDTHYLGANLPADHIVRIVAEREAEVVAISATLASHVGQVADLIRRLRAGPGAPRAKVLVGGYPFNLVEGLWARVGADGFARNAQEAGAVAAGLVAAPDD